MKRWLLLFLLSCYHRLRRFLGRQAWDCATCCQDGGSYLDIRGCGHCARLCCVQCVDCYGASNICIHCAAEGADGKITLHIPEEI